MIVDREVTSGIEALLGGDALAAPFTRARRPARNHLAAITYFKAFSSRFIAEKIP